MKIAVPALCAALVFALAACSADTKNYPSLARRAVERGSGTETPAPAPSPIAPSIDQLAQMAAAVTRATQAHVKFGEARPGAQQRVAAGSGSAPGSEAWAIGSVALAGLESTRSAAMIALADLDQLYVAARIEGRDIDAIVRARDEVTGLIAEEDRVLAELRGKLGD
jgi:hypothetical protein